MNLKNLASYSVLVVDDELIVRRALCRMLKRTGLTVFDAKDGQEAWDIIQKRIPNLVVSDMNMPHLNGLQLLKKIQENKLAIPFIMITGMPSVDAAVECLKIGAVDYLSKPFEMKKFRDTVSKILEQHSGEKFKNNSLPVIDNHRIIEPIGEGNNGIVFLVENIENGKTPVKRAMKMLKLSVFPQQQQKEMRKRFILEAQAASKINHPNVIKFYKYGLVHEDDIPYLIMEYFPSTSLKNALPTVGMLDYYQKAKILLQITSGLIAIHKNKICHRDIKPGNIMINPKKLIAKISDFGIARLPDNDVELTQNLIGSPSYMAPESYLSSRVDYRADIFSLGILGYELFIGSRPFDGINIGVLVHQIPNDAPKEPKSIYPDFPIGIQNILAKMLRKDPEDRYQNLEEAAQHLKWFIEKNAKYIPSPPANPIADWS